MSGIRGRDTNPELQIRRLLHAQGFRFRLHGNDLPGKPDIVFPKYGAVIFIHGCFWHGHDCHLFKWPSTRPEFWRTKIASNQQRDCRAVEALNNLGWRVATVWECALKGRARRDEAAVAKSLANWLSKSNRKTLKIRGVTSAG